MGRLLPSVLAALAVQDTRSPGEGSEVQIDGSHTRDFAVKRYVPTARCERAVVDTLAHRQYSL